MEPELKNKEIRIVIVTPSFDIRSSDLDNSKKSLAESFLKRGIEVEFADFLVLGAKFYSNEVTRDFFDNNGNKLNLKENDRGGFRNNDGSITTKDGKIYKIGEYKDRQSEEKYKEFQQLHIPKRGEKILEALTSDCDIIWTAMGGTGTTSAIVSNKENLKSAKITNPKLLLGYSDTTALHNFCVENYPDKIISVQAPGFVDFASSSEKIEHKYKPFLDKLADIICHKSLFHEYDLINLNDVKIEGEIKGKSVGGSVLMPIDDTHMRGYEGSEYLVQQNMKSYIPWSPKLADKKIFFLEPPSFNLDVSIEALNKNYRFFCGGKISENKEETFGEAKAIVLGNFGNKTPEELQNLLRTFLDKMNEVKIPVYQMQGSTFGHFAFPNEKSGSVPNEKSGSVPNEKSGFVPNEKSGFVPIVLDEVCIENNKMKMMIPDIFKQAEVTNFMPKSAQKFVQQATQGQGKS